MDNNGDGVRMLQELIERYSPTGQEHLAVEYLVNQMSHLGFRTTIDAVGNAIGTVGSGSREILLLGHIDTVPGYIPVVYEQDQLRGRGAVDAKGPLACFVYAAARCRVDPDWKITVVGAVGEEGDSRGAKHLMDRTPPEMVVIGEPSGWDRITLGYKGSALFCYTVQRQQAHPASGMVTGCEAAVIFWNDFQAAAAKYNANRARVFDQMTPSLRAMKSSEDGFGQTASLKIGVRLPEGLSVTEVHEMLDDLGGEARVELEDGIPAFRSNKNTPLVRSLLAAIRKYGGHPSFTLKTGTSDMNLVGPTWNCPIVAYGPGDSRLDHTPREAIVISEYLTSIQILGDSLQRIMAVE